MKIGDIVEIGRVEWTVVRVNEKAKPIVLRTIGRQPDIRIGSRIETLNAVVESKAFQESDGYTQIDLEYSRDVR